MRGLRAAILCVLIAVSACSLPERDNPNDPTNAPVVEVRLLDYSVGAPGAPCPVFTGTGVETGAASRGACLAFVANAVDRFGTAVTGSAFAWTLVDGRGDAIGAPLPETGRFLVLDTAFRLSQTPNVITHMKATVRDGEGNVGSGIGDFVLLNSPPVAVPGPPITIPYGGLYGAPDLPVAARLDGSRSYDADGDALRLCWSDGATETCSPRGDLSPTTWMVTPSPRRRVSLRLIADDGTTASAPRYSVVNVRERPTWVSGQGPYTQLDSGIWDVAIASTASFVSFNSAGQIMDLAGTPTIAASFGEFSPNQSVVSALPLRRGESMTARALFHDTAPVATRVVTRTDRSRFWTFAAAFDGAFRLFDVSTGGNGLAVTPVTNRFLSSSPLPFDFLENYELAMDSTDRLWIATSRKYASDDPYAAGMIVVAADDETTTVLFDDDSLNFVSLAHRPGHDEVWAMAHANPGAATTQAPIGIYVWNTLTDTARVIPIEGIAPVGAAWVSPEYLWFSSTDGRLRFVDVVAWEQSGLDAATLFEAELPGGIRQLSVDPVTWACHGIGEDTASGYAASVRVELDGAISVIPQLSGGHYGLVGDAETLHPLALGIAVSRAHSATEAVNQLYITNDLTSVSDPRTGGIFAASQVPAELSRHAEDGTLMNLWTTVLDEQGSRIEMPVLFRIFPVPDGNSLWAIAGAPYFNDDSLVRLDLSGETPRMETVIPAPGAYAAFATTFHPGAPASGQLPFAWTTFMTAGTSYVGTLASDATYSPKLSLSNLTLRGSALADDSNSLCATVEEFGASLFRFVRVPVAGAPVEHGTASNAGGLKAGAFATEGPNELCWYWIGRRPGPSGTAWSLEVRAYSKDGMLMHDGTTSLGTYAPMHFAGAGESRFWLLSDDDTNTLVPQVILSLVEVTPAGAVSRRNMVPTTAPMSSFLP